DAPRELHFTGGLGLRGQRCEQQAGGSQGGKPLESGVGGRHGRTSGNRCCNRNRRLGLYTLAAETGPAARERVEGASCRISRRRPNFQGPGESSERSSCSTAGSRAATCRRR